MLLTDEVTTAGLTGIDENGGNDGYNESSIGKSYEIKYEEDDRTGTIQSRFNSYKIYKYFRILCAHKVLVFFEKVKNKKNHYLKKMFFICSI